MTRIRQSVLAVSFVGLALLAATAHRWLLTIEQPLSQAARGDALFDAFAVITLFGATDVTIAAAIGLATATGGDAAVSQLPTQRPCWSGPS